MPIGTSGTLSQYQEKRQRVSYWSIPGLKDRRKPSDPGPSGPAGGERQPAPPLDQQRRQLSLSARVARVPFRGALWQVRHNRFQKELFSCDGTRARAKRVRGGLNVAACSSTAQRVPEFGFPYGAGPLLTLSHPTAPLVPAGPSGRFSLGALGPEGVCWSPWGI
jgi:hypothetical protein